MGGNCVSQVAPPHIELQIMDQGLVQWEDGGSRNIELFGQACRMYTLSGSMFFLQNSIKLKLALKLALELSHI